jgi:hypothetical protein
MDLLLCCARTRLPPATEERIEQLVRLDLNWEAVLERARNDGLAALLHLHLSARDIPTGVRDSLREQALDNVRWNLFLTVELGRLAGLFEKRGVQALAFKGLTLAADLYGDIGLREIADLDFLLSPKQAPLARDLLLEIGYIPEYRFTPKQDSAYRRYHYAYVLTHPVHEIVVELHWRITARFFCFDLDIDRLSRPWTAVRVEDQAVPAMCPEDLLILLCTHGAKHCWDRLIWLADVAQLVAAKPKLDWFGLLEKADRLGARRMVYLGLHLAGEFLQAPLPEEIADLIRRERALQGLATDWLAHLAKLPAERGMFSKTWFHIRCRERWRDRVRYLWRLATHSSFEDWSLVSLPESLSFLYAFLRLPRLFRKYLFSAGR